MNIKQLRCICAVACCDLNVTRAAASLHTSQPGVSIQIQMLEQELGLQIFERRGNRLVSTTSQGEAIIARAQRALLEIDELRDIGRTHLSDEIGTLTIAACHAQARFILPKVLREFTARYPKVNIVIKHGAGPQITELLRSRQADIGLLSGVDHLAGELTLIACQRYRRLLVVAAGHPLSKLRKPTLADIAAHPIVQYDTSKSGEAVMQVFATQGLSPRSVLHGTNADVVKAYVEQGLGVAILPELVFDRRRDPGLRGIDVSHLFAGSTSYVLLHRSHFQRKFGYEFIEMLAPHLTRQIVQEALLPESRRS
jgi:DNA-binding transcriptional LysR family regulator